MDDAKQYWCYNNGSTTTFSELDFDISQVYLTLTGIMSTLSIAGALTIIYLILTIPGLRTPSRMFLVYLSCSDMMLALGNFSSVIW